MTDAGGSRGGYCGRGYRGIRKITNRVYAGRVSPVDTSWKDGGWGTSDEFSIRSVEVVNPHSWPVFAKIAKIGSGEWEPTQTDAMAGGCKPTQAETSMRGASKREASRTYEVDAFFFGWRQTAASAAVVLGRR